MCFTRYFFFSLIIKAACLGWEHDEIWKFKRAGKEKQDTFWQAGLVSKFIVLTPLLSAPVGVVCIFERLELNVTNILGFKTSHFQV